MGMKKKEEQTAVPPVPSLPVTSVNPQPRNEASPVAPAKKAVQPLEQKKEKAGDDKGFTKETMTKADWSNKDKNIAVLSLIGRTMASPFLAQLTMGQDVTTALKTFDTVYAHALKTYEAK